MQDTKWKLQNAPTQDTKWNLINAPAQDQELSELLNAPQLDEFERQWFSDVMKLLDMFSLGSRCFSACIAGMIGDKIPIAATEPKRQDFLSKSQRLKMKNSNELLPGYVLSPDEQRKRADFIINIETVIGVHEKLRSKLLAGTVKFSRRVNSLVMCL